MSKRSVGIIGLMLALVLTLAACSNDGGSPSTASESSSLAQPQGADAGTYSASEPINYSFDYPELWKMEESGDPNSPVQFFGEGVSVALNIEEIGEASLDDYASAAQEALGSIEGLTVESQTDSTLGGEPAVTIVSTQAKGDTGFKRAQTFAIVDGYAFVVTYGGSGDRFDADLGTAQTIIDSFIF